MLNGFRNCSVNRQRRSRTAELMRRRGSVSYQFNKASCKTPIAARVQRFVRRSVVTSMPLVAICRRVPTTKGKHIYKIVQLDILSYRKVPTLPEARGGLRAFNGVEDVITRAISDCDGEMDLMRFGFGSRE